MKILKRLVIVPLLTFAVVLILVVIVLHIILSPDRLKPQIESLAVQHLHRQIFVENPKMSLWKLHADKLSIATEPGQPMATLITFDDALITWPWRQVFQAWYRRDWSAGPWSGLFKADRATSATYEAKGFLVRWNLEHLDSQTLLHGWVTVEHGRGILRLKPDSSGGSILASLVTLEREGILTLGIPDLTRLPLERFDARFDFSDGLARISRFRLDSPNLHLQSSGQMVLKDHGLVAAVEIRSREGTPKEATAVFDVNGPVLAPRFVLRSFKRKSFRASMDSFLRDSRSGHETKDTLRRLFQ